MLSLTSFKDKIYIKIIDFINNFLELYKLIAWIILIKYYFNNYIFYINEDLIFPSNVIYYYYNKNKYFYI